MPKSTESFIVELSNINPLIKVKGIYVNARSPIEVECLKCGHVWHPVANSLVKGYGCPKCAGNIKKTHEQFVQEIAEKNPTIEITGQYVNAKSKIQCTCLVCGHIWYSKANNIQQGQACPKCANKKRNDGKRISQEQFLTRLEKTNPNLQILGTHISAHNRILVRCLHCGHEWRPLSWDILRGTGCPNCSHTSTSFVEQFILLSFQKVLGEDAVLSRNSSLVGKELDIYIPRLNLAIEPGSWYWHKTKVENDLEKVKLCKQKGIRLIVIYDKCDIESPPFADCYITKSDFSNENSIEEIKQLVCDLFKTYSIPFSFSEEEWSEIKASAYLKSRKISTEDFKKRLSAVSDVIVIGEYIGYNSKILCKCPQCEYEWESTPGHLLEGKKCPKCAGRMRYSTAEFAEKLKMQPDIEVVGEYQNSSTPIQVRCMKCKHQWSARPYNLLTGYGCPQCGIIQQAAKQRLSHDDFLQRMDKKGNPDVELIGQYYDYNTKILCRCKKCGYQWEATPKSLVQGNGCHKCKGGVPKKVHCITTNHIFSSVKDAAQFYGISYSGINNCCRKKQLKCGGKEWEYINENQK